MCGFAGCLTDRTKADNAAYDQTIHEMTKMIVHRGPDDDGYFADDNITMGFRRLSIIDLAGGHQPLSYDNERYWMTFNGEIYNYVELREQLKQEGYEFKTSSDSEVILAMYAKYHADATKYLRGMFAFVIWDKQEKRYLPRAISSGSSRSITLSVAMTSIMLLKARPFTRF